MSDINMTDIPSMDADEIVEQFSEIYITAIDKNLAFKTIPSVMLWGPPGVGKSQAIYQIADRITRETSKKAVVTDVRLILFNPVDLRGIPTADKDNNVAVWLKPHIFNMDSSDDIVNILFLDEISAAPQSVQAAAYQITLDRTIGEHHLPENCIVIAAGNRTTDKSVSYKMPKALANRLMHINVEYNFRSWVRWATRKGINQKVIDFLLTRQNYLMTFDTSGDDLAFSTPRSWEMVSNLLNNINDDVESMYPFIAGIIGTGMAIEFRSWAKLHSAMPDIKNIFDGKEPPLPQNTDTLYSLVSQMTTYAKAHPDDIERIINSLKYAEKMPADFSTLLVKNYMNISTHFKHRLMSTDYFTDLIQRKGAIFNGIN